jgi:hypothetical protein
MAKDFVYTAGLTITMGIAVAFFLSRLFVLAGQWADLVFNMLLAALGIVVIGALLYAAGNVVYEVYLLTRRTFFKNAPPRKRGIPVPKGLERRSLRLAEQKARHSST